MAETVIIVEKFVDGDMDHGHMEFYDVFASVESAKAAIVAKWHDHRQHWRDRHFWDDDLLWETDSEGQTSGFVETFYPGEKHPDTQVLYTLTEYDVQTEAEAAR